MPRTERGKLVYEVHAEFCKTFAHPVRLALLDSFRSGEKTVTQLAQELGIRQSTVSQQLSLLKRMGAVLARRDGRQLYYRLADRRILKAYDLVDQIVRESRMTQAKVVE
jgi:ArsR family transcriptional regulator, virulence genes transcriptional regulator